MNRADEIKEFATQLRSAFEGGASDSDIIQMLHTQRAGQQAEIDWLVEKLRQISIMAIFKRTG